MECVISQYLGSAADAVEHTKFHLSFLEAPCFFAIQDQRVTGEYDFYETSSGLDCCQRDAPTDNIRH